MKKLFLTTTVVIVLGLSTFANANLNDNTGGFIYDTDLNITWFAVPFQTYSAWNVSMNNALSGTFGGVGGWRLPATTAGAGNNVGEMGHLFYNELGGTAGQSIVTNHNANYSLFSNLFTGNVVHMYWTNLIGPGDNAWYFNFLNGSQDEFPRVMPFSSLVVHDGNVSPPGTPPTNPVPEPATMLLLGSGLIGLAGYGRKKFFRK